MNLRYARNNIYVCDSAYKSRPNGMFLKVDLSVKVTKCRKKKCQKISHIIMTPAISPIISMGVM